MQPRGESVSVSVAKCQLPLQTPGQEGGEGSLQVVLGACKSGKQPCHLKPNVIGTACCKLERPGIGVVAVPELDYESLCYSF